MYVQGEELVFGALGGFAALTEHPGVGKLQRYLNNFAARAGFAPLGVDNKYGGCTHLALKKFATWYSKLPGSTLLYVGDTMFNSMGPLAVAQFLAPGVPPYAGLTGAELAEASTGWAEWVKAGSPACGSATSGGGDETGEEIVADGGDGNADITTGDITPPQIKRAGMGTLGWFLVGLGVVVIGGIAYYVATRPSSQPATAGLFEW